MRLQVVGLAVLVLFVLLMSGAGDYLCICNANFASRKALSSHEVSCSTAQNGANVTSLFKKRKLAQEKARAAKRQARAEHVLGGQPGLNRVEPSGAMNMDGSMVCSFPASLSPFLFIDIVFPQAIRRGQNPCPIIILSLPFDCCEGARQINVPVQS